MLETTIENQTRFSDILEIILWRYFKEIFLRIVSHENRTAGDVTTRLIGGTNNGPTKQCK